MNFTNLLLTVEEQVSIITINRPKNANSLNWDTI